MNLTDLVRELYQRIEADLESDDRDDSAAHYQRRADLALSVTLRNWLDAYGLPVPGDDESEYLERMTAPIVLSPEDQERLRGLIGYFGGDAPTSAPPGR